MEICTSLLTDNHASTPPLIFTGWMLFLPPKQQHQSTVSLEVKLNSVEFCILGFAIDFHFREA